VGELLLNNAELFKNNENKRQELLEIIFACMQEKNKELKDFFRELGKVDKEFRKLYVFHTISSVEKVQVLKILIERNNLSLVDVW
jgi:hypothetical protein